MNGDDNTTRGRPPAVLQLVPRLLSGGAERGTVELAAALAAAGWTSYVASAGGPLERDLAHRGTTHLTLPLTAKNPFAIHRNARPLKRMIRRLGIDIVHARSRAPAWSGWLAARATGRHFVTTFHNAYQGRSWLKWRYNSIMARGARVIAISEFVADHAARVYGVGPERLRMIPRGVDLEFFSPQRVGGPRIAALAREWRLPDDAPVVILPGRLTRWKGGLDFIAAAALVGRRDVCWVLVGAEQHPGFRGELEAAIAKAGACGFFRMVGDCQDMPAAYMLADIVVSASRHPEGFGRVIAEAQAMGRPVVATDHGGARQTIISAVTGWLVPPRAPAALAAAIGTALALGSEERALLARRARANISDSGFTAEAMCARTIRVYEELLFPELQETAAEEGAPFAVPA
jgi:glycosyltransferase involved in cell wall biosynthesis